MSGIPQLFLLPLMPLLMRKVDPRLLVLLGLLMFAASCFINVDMSPDTAMDQLILPQLLRAAGSRLRRSADPALGRRPDPARHRRLRPSPA